MEYSSIVFKAIAHPARRQIISLLSDSRLSVKELTAVFEMSQPAVSQHLRELKNAKIVSSKKVGMEQQYRLTGGPLKLVFEWSSRYRRFFDPSGHAWALVAAPVADKSASIVSHKSKRVKTVPVKRRGRTHGS